MTGWGSKREFCCLLPADDPKVMNLFATCAACDMPAIIHINTKMDRGYGIYDDRGLPPVGKGTAGKSQSGAPRQNRQQDS